MQYHTEMLCECYKKQKITAVKQYFARLNSSFINVGEQQFLEFTVR